MKAKTLENRLKVGLITAGGTGREVSQVLRKVLDTVSSQYNLNVQYKEFEQNPKTYWELKDTPDQKSEVEKREISDIVEFCREASVDGYDTIFQTATNAGTLYQQRMLTEMMKVMQIPTENGDILLTREQSQGFYAIDSKNESSDRIDFSCSYSKEKLYRTLDASIKEANERFGNENYSVRLVYKFHLFDQFNEWIKEYIAERGLEDKDIQVVQPDTGYDYLMRKFPRGKSKDKKENVLCVVSNEIGDIFTEALPNHYGVGDKATMYATNVSLEPRTLGQVVYQTIHGSADDIAGQNKLNPFATIRAAANILETKAGIRGINSQFEQALDEARTSGYVTPDLGGTKTTNEVVDFVLDYVGERKMNSQYTIKPLELKLINETCKVIQHSLRETLKEHYRKELIDYFCDINTSANLEKRKRENIDYFVATNEKEVFGVIGLSKGENRIRTFYVNPDNESKSILSNLFNYLRRESEERGYNSLIVNANPFMRNIYSSFGFQLIKEVSKEYNGIPCLEYYMVLKK